MPKPTHGDTFSSHVPAVKDGIEVRCVFEEVSQDSYRVVYRGLIIGYCVQRLVTRPWKFRANPSGEYSLRQLMDVCFWLQEKNAQGVF